MASQDLHPNHLGCINTLFRNLNWEHPALQGIEPKNKFSNDTSISIVATRLREAVITPPTNALSPSHSVGARIGRKDETIAELLERCSLGTWVSTGREHTFKDGLDYRIIPDASLQSQGVPFGEWTWQINRHHEWLLIAQAFKKSEDNRYATTLADWMNTWITQCPPPAFDLNANQASWRTIEIGIRLAQTWPGVLDALKRSDALNDALFLAWLGSWVAQSYFVWEHRKGHNWLYMEMAGLASAGSCLPFLRDASLFRDLAVQTIDKELDKQVYPDGMQFELSPGYHLVCIKNCESIMTALRKCGHEVPVAFEEKVYRLYEPLRKLTRPDHYLWAFQDSPNLHLPTILKRIPEEHLEPGDEFFTEEKGSPPEELHSVLPYAGYAILRTGWQEDALCLAFDGGPIGAAHQHEDKLAFQLSAFKTNLIGEAGIVDYQDSPERRYCLTTLAHSAALLDGEGQSRLKNCKEHTATNKAGMTWGFDEKNPWVQASYTNGFGPKQAIQVSHKRTLALLDDDLVAVFDRFNSHDTELHTVELLFHILLDEVEALDCQVTSHASGANIGLASKAIGDVQLSSAVITGKTEPDLRGWAQGDPSPKSATWTLVPKPCLTVKGTFCEELEVITLIRVYPPGAKAEPPQFEIQNRNLILDEIQ